MGVVHEVSKSIHHRSLVEAAKSCGCYHCCRTFEPHQIREWTDDDDTALCPLCGVDAVIPDIREEDLTALRKYLFG